MAIIRNERATRPAPEPPEDSVSEEEEIDYRWHPTEDEFVSPLTAEQWADLLRDSAFSETDAAKAVRCLHEYGGPATFQQLSIRYRGTMGRYRRWLGEAAHEAGKRYGVEAPQKDQFGMDEWWPLLYLTRATGKPGANVFEMQLRPEVQEAFELILEQEKQEKRAENVRQLQRIEQLERARQEERERRAAEQAALEEMQRAEEERRAAELAAAEEARRAAEERQMAETDVLGEGQSLTFEQVAGRAKLASASQVRTVAEVTGMARAETRQTSASASAQDDVPQGPLFPALVAFLEAVRPSKEQGGSRFIFNTERADVAAFDSSGPIDYALRYAERLREVLALVRAGYAGVSAAAVARALGDSTVQRMQDILNGQAIPEFSYLDTMKERLFVNPAYLEVPEGVREDVPAFCTFDELLCERGEEAALVGDWRPRRIAYVVDDSRVRRTGVILSFSDVSCALLTRGVVEAESKARKNPELDAFVRMVDELDSFAREKGIARTSHTVSSDDWDRLVAGTVWPGALI